MRDEFVLVLESLRSSWFQVLRYLPRTLVAVVLLTSGWLLARVARWSVVKALRLIRLDVAAERIGLDDFLVRGGVRFTVVTLVGLTVYWSVLLVFLLAGFNALGFTLGPAVVERLAGFMPGLVAGLVVLVFGSLGARFVRGLAEAYLNNVGVKDAANIGLSIHGVLLAFVAILALEQLGIAVNLLATTFQLAFGAICLALAVAFGLGGKNWAEAFIERKLGKR